MVKTKAPSKADVARKYRDEYGDKMPMLQLARIMYKKNKKLFASVESARDALRYIEGKKGEKMAKPVKGSSYFRNEARPLNPYVIPESKSKPKPVFKLPIACNRIGFMSDFQIPYHDIKPIKAFVEWLKTKNVNTIFLNGDVIDFFSISDFEKDPRNVDFKYELDATKEFLGWLRGEFPTATIYYNLDANHELRWERWLIKRAKEVLDMDEFKLDVILQLNKHNIIPLQKNKYILIGKLPVLHGHTVFGKFGAGVSKARSVWMKTLKSCIASHVHVTDEYTKKDLAGEMTTCWTTGCFMDINAVEYNEHNDYNHGGAYIETELDGTFHVENKRILNGKIL